MDFGMILWVHMAPRGCFLDVVKSSECDFLGILNGSPPREQIVASRPGGRLVRTRAVLLFRRRTMSLFLLYESL